MTKRLIDVILSSAGLVALSPLFAAAAVLVRTGSPGPVFFRQTRIGLRGRHFSIVKFRTMAHSHAISGPQITAGNDSRITREGRWLRRWGFDELPQLLNVLAGDMSVVGPRPEVPLYASLWPAELRSAIVSVRPGLTDPATLRFFEEEKILAKVENPERTYIEEILPVKAVEYANYATTHSTLGDLRLIIATLKALVFKSR